MKNFFYSFRSLNKIKIGVGVGIGIGIGFNFDTDPDPDTDTDTDPKEPALQRPNNVHRELLMRGFLSCPERFFSI